MAQVEKYNMRQAIAIIAHCERTGEKHSNKNIDPERTKDNYSLWPEEDPDTLVLDTDVPGQSSERYAYKRMKKRLSEVSCLDRKDVNVLCDWCIHLGVDVPPGYDSQKAFFKACVKYICNTYGEENVTYAWVHMDEENPHIHIGFVPVIKKQRKLRKNASERLKKEYEEAKAAGNLMIERVDADSIITRKHLQDWHGNFSSHMKDTLGYDPAVYTGVTEELGGNVSVKQLKHKPKDWRVKRNIRAAAFHEVRRAASEGRQADFEALEDIAIIGRPQAPEEPKMERKSLFDKIRDAGGRGNE